jgi:branched-chain amino acid transport system permease protein
LQNRALKPAVKPAAWRGKVARWIIPFAIGFVVAYPAIVLATAGWPFGQMDRDISGIEVLILRRIGMGPEHALSASPDSADLGYVAFLRGGRPTPMRCSLRPYLAFVLDPPAARRNSRLILGNTLGFRCCGFAATTLPSSPRLRRDNPMVLINWVDLTNGYAGITSIPRPAILRRPVHCR